MTALLSTARLPPLLALALALITAPHLSAQQQNHAQAEDAIRANSTAYVEAFNNADTDALAAHWAEDAVFINQETGEELHGRDAIAAAFTKSFAAETKPRLEATIDAIRFVTDDVAIEEGSATLILPGAPPHLSNYSAVLVLRDDQWLIQRVYETIAPKPSAHREHLAPIAWLVGEWIDENENSAVHYTCDWVANHNFLRREFTIHTPEGADFEGIEIIGWDPLEENIRSWLFDSEGGFAERKWKFRSGENEDYRWIIHGNGVIHGGQKASAVHIITPVDDNHYTFEAVSRELGGELLPNIDETLIRRVPSH
ncbi:MAG: SgcJ/EcaC family oxidoreductase [Verrucomicrobiota bacterium]